MALEVCSNTENLFAASTELTWHVELMNISVIRVSLRLSAVGDIFLLVLEVMVEFSTLMFNEYPIVHTTSLWRLGHIIGSRNLDVRNVERAWSLKERPHKICTSCTGHSHFPTSHTAP